MSRSSDPLSTAATNLPSVIPYYAASDTGFANSNGIVFSSINTNTPGTAFKPISNPFSTFVFSNPIQTQISKPPDTSVQSSNFHQVINSNTNYLQPINLPAAQTQSNPVKTQAIYSSSGFTFAPLVSAISLPMIPLQTGNSTAQQNHPNNQAFLQQSKPPTATRPSVNQELADPVSMLRPVNKCGITKYINSRVVGGSVTQIGMQTIAFVRKVKPDIERTN